MNTPTPNQFDALSAESAEDHFAQMTSEEDAEYRAYLDSLKSSEDEPEDAHLDALFEERLSE